MTEKPENAVDKLPDRPLECSECKKPIAVWYTEIVGNSITHTSMCAECPELEHRLRGISSTEREAKLGEPVAGLACGECGTTLNAIRVGNLLGCSNCYEVFGDIILSELGSTEKIPARLINNKKSGPIHIGRAPGESREMNPSLRLLALNEALNETLKREDYEQAAWLRDQIKALTENTAPENSKEKKQEKNND